MTRPDGYEELPEGTEPFLPQPGPQSGTTLTQTPAPNSAPAPQQQHGGFATGPPIALGMPAFPQQGLGANSHLEQLPAFPDYLAALPTAADEWERSTVLFSVWLGCSAATFAVALLTLNMLGIAGGACATVAAATHRFSRLRSNLSLADAVNRILRLAIAAACCTGFVALTSILIAVGLSAACPSADDKAICATLTEVTTLFAVWYSLSTVLTVAVLRRTASIKRLLNPVSSGAVTL